MEQAKKDKFNENQRLAVFTSDKDILVSAGAGCGKTFVMIERIAENIINKKVSVDELLVVTYTNAAASEMRIKLNTKINELLQDSSLDEADKSYLRLQADLIGQSDICTLHKFCQNIIKKYAYTLDIDPSFTICEDSEANLLRNSAINEVFSELIAENNADFALLADTFDDKRGYDKISKYVFKIYDFLNNQPDIESFKRKVNSGYNDDLNSNRFAQTINKNTVEFFEHYVLIFSALKREAMLSGLTRLVELLDNYVTLLQGINATNDFYQNHRLVYALSLKALPRTSVSPEDDAMKTRISDIKKGFSDGLKKVRENYITSDIEELKAGLFASQKIVNAMFMLVDRFSQKYLELKKSKNLVDFSDLEHFAYQILRNPVVGKEISNKYKQIYVDEYQDVNDIQEGIINLVHKSRDIFLVGDVKQSIYGFRNTNPQIFLDKLENFGQEGNIDSTTIPLNENYRSDQRILDYVNMVFAVLMTKDFAGIDYLPSHEMLSGAGYQSVEGALPSVEIMVINKTREQAEKEVPTDVYRVSTAPLVEDLEQSYAKSEAHAIYSKIMQLLSEQKQIYDAKKKCYRDIEFSDITILARTRSNGLMEILNELSALGLPIAPVSKDSITTEYEVKLLFEYLSLLNNRTDDVLLTGFLVSPIVGLDERDLVAIRLGNPQCDSFFDCVMAYKVEDEIRTKINYALGLIERGRQTLLCGSIYDVLSDFCKRTNYLHLVAAMENGETRVSNVMGYINSFIGKKYNYDLVDYLANVTENNGEQNIAKEPNAGASVIGVATMHQSKGLEYPIVFMVDCGHNYNMEDKRGDFLLNSELGVGMYTYDSTLRTKKKTILHSAVKIAIKDKDLAERERLLYVAMTRAKNHLFISGAINLDKFNSCTTAYALKNVQNDLSLILSSVSAEDIDTLRNKGELTQTIAPNNTINYYVMPAMHEGAEAESNNMTIKTEADAELVKMLNKNLDFAYKYTESATTAHKNAVTALNKIGKIKDLSAESDLGEIAEPKPESIDTEVGIAYHRAMQLIDFNLRTEDEVADFLRKNLTTDEFKMIDCGKILRAIQNLHPIVDGAELWRERKFVMKVPLCDVVDSPITDKVMIEGVVDLIAIKNGQVYIIDYKTSNSANLDKTARSYITQLRCYQRAIESANNCQVAQKFLYFFLQERLILIDNK